MGKRKKKSNNNNNNNNNNAKRFKSNDGKSNDNYDASRGYFDSTTGQRGAFPGLSREDEPFLGPAHDGLSYLRMVRSEAALVPPLLLSSSVPRPPPRPQRLRHQPSPRTYEVSVDTLDYDDPVPALDALDYDDPSSTSPPNPVDQQQQEALATSPTYSDNTDDDDDPNCFFAESTYVSLQKSPPPPPPPPYHTSLVSKFRAVRNKSHTNPPPPTPGLEFPRKFAHKWTMDTRPTMGLLWAMDMPKVISMTQNVTRMIGSGTRTVRRGIPKRVGEWVWALLVRCEDAMGPDEVYVVREMGKTALAVLKDVKEQWGEENGEVEEGGVENVEEEKTEQVEEAVEEDTGDPTNDAQPDTVQVDETEKGHVESLDSTTQNESVEQEQGPVHNNVDLSEPVKPKVVEEDVDWGYTQATLDMIISVVGDYFGQRDLLETRTLMEVG
ncbi:hypothetical protein EX30DRAFT_338906 [Ascodesmis nigricans]|uniref:Uncharacterized protein n=1 Tax=Ascodesmis nigricans TaxID=341454 RepID=A0A4V3SJK8_9PEZI|nr:hypothetical protein EX30DRAFT_338906 [Ascodesmis nigricans]